VRLPRWTAFGTYAVVAALGGAVAAALSGFQLGGPRSLIWFVALVALPLAALLLAQARHRRQGIGQARREAVLIGRDAQKDAARCRCWSHDALRHDTARLYLREHLAPVDLSAGEGSLLAVSDLATWVGRCPDSHIRWLIWQTTVEGGLIAVRGAPTGGVARPVATR
jgi:hypothetical protein